MRYYTPPESNDPSVLKALLAQYQANGQDPFASAVTGERGDYNNINIPSSNTILYDWRAGDYGNTGIRNTPDPGVGSGAIDADFTKSGPIVGDKKIYKYSDAKKKSGSDILKDQAVSQAKKYATKQAIKYATSGAGAQGANAAGNAAGVGVETAGAGANAANAGTPGFSIGTPSYTGYLAAGIDGVKGYQELSGDSLTDEEKNTRAPQIAGRMAGDIYTGGLTGLGEDYARAQWGGSMKKLDELDAKTNPLTRLANSLWASDEYKTEGNRLRALEKKGITIPEALKGPMNLKRGRSKAQLVAEEQAKASQGLYSNPTFAESRNEGDLGGKDIWGYSPFFDKFGNDWLGNYSEKDREEIANEALKLGLVNEHKGTIDIGWTPELEKFAKDRLGVEAAPAAKSASTVRAPEKKIEKSRKKKKKPEEAVTPAPIPTPALWPTPESQMSWKGKGWTPEQYGQMLAAALAARSGGARV